MKKITSLFTLLVLFLMGCSSKTREFSSEISRIQNENEAILSDGVLRHQDLILNLQQLDIILVDLESQNDSKLAKLAEHLGSLFRRGVFLSGNGIWEIGDLNFKSSTAHNVFNDFEEYRKALKSTAIRNHADFLNTLENIQRRVSSSNMEEFEAKYLSSYLFANRRELYHLYLDGYDFSKYAKNSYPLYGEIRDRALDFGFQM